MFRRPSILAAGIVRSVAIRPPMLKVLVAVRTHSWPITSIEGRPDAPAAVNLVHSTCARPLATTEINALQLHHVISAVTAMQKPLIVRARYFGEKSSEIFARCSLATAFQRSGSLIKSRTASAAAAGINPNKKTYRHETLGSVK